MTSAAALAAPAMMAAARKASPMPRSAAAVGPAAPAAMVARIAMPSEPPISWPVVFRPESIPDSCSAAPVSTETETETRMMPRPRPATSMPGSTSASVAAVRADAGEQQHPGGGDREAGRERDPHAGVGDDVAAGVHAGADRDGERQEREPGRERAGAEHVLQVQRGQQERAEQHRGGGEHHHEAAADGAVARGAGRAAAAGAVRSSSAAKAASPASAAAPRPSVCAEVQPLLWAWERA